MAIVVTCPCGKRLRVGDEHAGRKIRCPECEESLRVPEPDDDEPPRPKATARVRADRPPAKKPVARPARDDDDEREEPKRRPRRRAGKKQKSRSALPLILAGVGLLMVVGGGGFAGYWFLLRGDGGMTEAAFLPPDAQGFVTVRLAEVVKLDGYQKAIRAQGGEDPLNQVATTLGLAAADVERASFVVQDFEQKVGWAVVTTSKPYDQKAVLAKLQNASTQKHEGKTYHTGQVTTPGFGRPNPMMGGMGPGGRGGATTQQQSIFFAGPKLLVLAEADASMKRAFAAAARKSAAGPLANAVSQAGGSRHIYGAFNLPPGAREQIKTAVAMMGAQGKGAAALLQFTAGTVAVDFGANLVVDLSLKYADDSAAKEAVKSFTQLKDLAGKLMGMIPDPKAGEALKAVVAGLTAEQLGAEVAVKLQVASQLLEAAIPPGAGQPR